MIPSEHGGYRKNSLDWGRETKEETLGHALGEDGRARACRAGGPESAVQTVL